MYMLTYWIHFKMIYYLKSIFEFFQRSKWLNKLLLKIWCSEVFLVTSLKLQCDPSSHCICNNIPWNCMSNLFQPYTLRDNIWMNFLLGRKHLCKLYSIWIVWMRIALQCVWPGKRNNLILYYFLLKTKYEYLKVIIEVIYHH